MKAKDEGKVAVLLIDGLDVAVSRGLQAKFWQLVFEEVRSLDIQLLATTNSLDCIAGFRGCWFVDSGTDGDVLSTGAR